MKNTNTIKAEAAKIKEMGSPLSIERLEAILIKKAAGEAKRNKRIEKGFATRIARKNIDIEIVDIAELNRANAEVNLPSSMRR